FLSDNSVSKKFQISFNGVFSEIEMQPLWQETLNKAIGFLNECGFDIVYPVKAALFNNKDIMGCALNGTIYISDIGFERGVNELVNTLIEEYIHIKYDVYDESRGFQTAIITEMISYMKKVNSYAI